MSLQVALKETRERLGSVQKQARELGLAITEAELKGDDAVAKEKQASFDKALVDVETLMKSIQRTESLIEAERQSQTVVNGLPAGDPREAYSDGPVLAPSKETMERFSVDIHRCVNAYMRWGAKDERFSATAAGAIQRIESSKLAPEERQALVSSIGALGGALVPEDVRNEIIKNLAGFSVMLQSGVRVVPCSSNTLVFPSIAGGSDPWSTGYAGTWRPAGSVGTDGTAPAQQNQPTFGNERIPVHEWQPDAVVADPSFLEDSAVPVETVLTESIGETQALDFDYAFLRGDGIGKPRGIHDYIGSGVSAVNSGSTAVLNYDQLLDLTMTLPAQYREGAVFYMKSLTFGACLKLKDSSQQPILYQASVPGTLFGKKVWATEHMPSIAQNAYPILFGNPRYYIVAQRRDLRVQRLVERFAPNVAFLPTARVGGALVRPASFVAQKIST